MGWAIGYDESWQRDIGYGVPAYCDHPGCTTVIDRGLSHVCSDEAPYGGEGCGLYFCDEHRYGFGGECERCTMEQEPFDAKRDHPDWIAHKLTDESWQQWRDENHALVEQLKAARDGEGVG